MTQQGAAALLGIDQSKISRITRGQFRGAKGYMGSKILARTQLAVAWIPNRLGARHRQSRHACEPKADTLIALKPVAFADDYMAYFAGVDAGIHRALLQPCWGRVGPTFKMACCLAAVARHPSEDDLPVQIAKLLHER